jgi:hypothetical protein
LQLSGSGTEYADFSWQAAATETPDSVNNNQSFSGGVTDSATSVVVSTANSESNVAVDANISLIFNESVVISGCNTINCVNEVSVTVTAIGEGTSYVLDPDQDFAEGDSCSFTVSAADVTDLDGTPDNMAEDVSVVTDVIVVIDVIDNSVIVSLVINVFDADPAGDIIGDASVTVHLKVYLAEL